MNKRFCSVAGSFYPSDAASIEKMIFDFNQVIDAHPEIADQLKRLGAKAAIVPHAGWVYSGFTANFAYRVLQSLPWSSVVVIGPSHRVGFEGSSISDVEQYETPLGTIPIDRELVGELRSRFDLSYFPQAHHEHSTEVQMPFIRHYLPNVKVVELVYAYAQPGQIEPIIDYLLEKENLGVLISTDLSHFHTLEKANRLDGICLDAIRTENSQLLHEGCEACGAIGVEAMLNVAKRRGLTSTVLDYRTSADASGDASRVVGYVSALFE